MVVWNLDKLREKVLLEYIKVVAHNIKQAQVEYRRGQVGHRQELAKHKQVEIGLGHSAHKQELGVVGCRPGLVVRRQGLIPGLVERRQGLIPELVVRKREVLTLELANKFTEPIKLKVNITAVIEVADNIKELVVEL